MATVSNIAIWVPIIQVCIAALAAMIALIAVNRNFRSQRITTAEQTWHKYLELCLQNPEFADPSEYEVAGKFNFDNRTYNESKSEFQRYGWFFSYLLSTASIVVRARDNDRFWRNMIVLQISYHRAYLERIIKNDNFVANSEQIVVELVREAIKFRAMPYLNAGVSDELKSINQSGGV